MFKERLIEKPEVQVLLQKLSQDRSPATNTYSEIIYLLDEIMQKIDKIDVILNKFDNTLEKIEKEYDPNYLTPQQTGMSPGRCPIA